MGGGGCTRAALSSCMSGRACWTLGSWTTRQVGCPFAADWLQRCACVAALLCACVCSPLVTWCLLMAWPAPALLAGRCQTCCERCPTLPPCTCWQHCLTHSASACLRRLACLCQQHPPWAKAGGCATGSERAPTGARPHVLLCCVRAHASTAECELSLWGDTKLSTAVLLAGTAGLCLKGGGAPCQPQQSPGCCA